MSPAERRLYIDERLNKDWGWVAYQKGDLGLSLADIVLKLSRVTGERLSRTTIKRDIDFLRDIAKTPTVKELTEAQELLLPENFPEFRRRLFNTPEGSPYETPLHQFSAFWVMYALLHKVALPEWVIDYLDSMDPNPNRKLPKDLNERIIAGDKFITFEFLMAPRHGKTDLSTHFILHTHAGWPNMRIMWGNGTEKKTMQFIGNYIMPVLEHHKELNRLYGPFYNAGNWGKSGYIIATREGFSKMPSLQPFGLGGSIRSYDSDLIFADDLSDLKRARNETVTEGDAEWVAVELMTRRERHTPFFNFGSHLPIDTGDIFVHLEDRLEKLREDPGSLIIIKKLPAHDYDKCDSSGNHVTCVIWPTVRPYTELESQRLQLADDAMFEAVYNQTPMSSEMMHFPHDRLREEYRQEALDVETGIKPGPEVVGGMLDRKRNWKKVPKCCKGREVLVAAGFDPAVSEDRKASFTALAVLGACPFCGRRYVIDYFQIRQSPELHPGLIDQYLIAYPEIDRLRIEDNAYQKALARDPRLGEIVQRNKVWIDEWRTDERKWDPVLGIPQMGRHIKNGMWSVPFELLSDQEFAETLIKTFIRWPKRPNDLIMAFWLAELSLMEMIEDFRRVSTALMPGTEKYHTEWHDEITYSVDLADIEAPPDEYGYT